MKKYPSVELLELFVDLMRTQSLSATAAALEIPVSTASRQLSELRQFFEDELFYRCRQGLMPTHKARDLQPAVLALLGGFKGLKNVKEFDPASLEQEIRIGCVDNAPVAIFPHLVEQLREISPGLCLTVYPLDSNRYDMLRRREVDLVISPMTIVPSENFHSLDLPEQKYCLVCGKNHPLAERCRENGPALETQEILQYRFVDILLSYRRHGTALLRNIVYPEFAAARSAVRTYFFLPFVNAVEKTDLLMVVPEKTADSFLDRAELTVLKTQARPVSHTPKMIWHDITHVDPAMQWVRSMIYASAAT